MKLRQIKRRNDRRKRWWQFWSPRDTKAVLLFGRWKPHDVLILKSDPWHLFLPQKETKLVIDYSLTTGGKVVVH